MAQAPISKPLKNIRRERFAQALASGLSVRESYERSGFAGDPNGNAPSKLHREEEVQRRVAGILAKSEAAVVHAVAVTQAEIVQSLRETRDMARVGVPVLAKDGSETGVYRPDLAAKNRADDTLAKVAGLYRENDRPSAGIELPDDPEEIREQVFAIIEQIDPGFFRDLKATIRAELESEVRAETKSPSSSSLH